MALARRPRDGPSSMRTRRRTCSSWPRTSPCPGASSPPAGGRASSPSPPEGRRHPRGATRHPRPYGLDSERRSSLVRLKRLALVPHILRKLDEEEVRPNAGGSTRGLAHPAVGRLSLEADLLVGAVAHRLGGGGAAAAEIGGVALDGDRIALRIQHLDAFALDHEGPIGERLDDDGH